MSSATPAPASEESLIVYPSPFPIKVMGIKQVDLVHTITTIARTHDPSFDASTIELRESKEGKYLSVTITVNATSRDQLDDIYRALSSHELIKFVL